MASQSRLGRVAYKQDVMQTDDPISDGASWYAEASVRAPERPRLTFDLDLEEMRCGARHCETIVDGRERRFIRRCYG